MPAHAPNPGPNPGNPQPAPSKGQALRAHAGKARTKQTGAMVVAAAGVIGTVMYLGGLPHHESNPGPEPTPVPLLPQPRVTPTTAPSSSTAPSSGLGSLTATSNPAVTDLRTVVARLDEIEKAKDKDFEIKNGASGVSQLPRYDAQVKLFEQDWSALEAMREKNIPEVNGLLAKYNSITQERLPEAFNLAKVAQLGDRYHSMISRDQLGADEVASINTAYDELAAIRQKDASIRRSMWEFHLDLARVDAAKGLNLVQTPRDVIQDAPPDLRTALSAFAK